MFKTVFRWFIRVFSLSFLLAITALIVLVYDYNNFLNSAITADKTPGYLSVKSGDNIHSLIRRYDGKQVRLKSNDILIKPLASYYFKYLVKGYSNPFNLNIGDYSLSPSMTPPELLDRLANGKTIQYKIRFQEGWTLKQIRKAITQHDYIDQTLAHIDDDEIISALGLPKNHYEGLFFPDTYLFSEGTTDSDILLQAYYAMQKNLNKAWKHRNQNIQLKSPYELLTLASIIEKETWIASEMKKISGVFHRRLKKNMRLQTDPTVIYGMGDRYQGKIYKSDLKRDTAYNTYTRHGLPPTPIAAPGLNALTAAGQPDNKKALFFVATGTGGHVFSNTYKQHLKAVKAYRKAIKKSSK